MKVGGVMYRYSVIYVLFDTHYIYIPVYTFQIYIHTP